MTSTPKGILLMDALGATLTALLLSLILAPMEDFFGMPQKVVYFLATLASIFAIYSFWSHWFIKQNHAHYLKFIAKANLSYAVLSACLLAYYRYNLTAFGWSYFIAEIVIILGLVRFEFKTVRKHS